MVNPTQFNYHGAIFARLGIEPVMSATRQALIAERERMSGVCFPASVRELFAIEGVEKVVSDRTTHYLVDVEELGSPAEVAQGYLRIGDENQGVVAWYVRLDGSDDPTVLDNNGDSHENLTEVTWRLCSSHFSHFVFDWLTGHNYGLEDGQHVYGATHSALVLAGLDQAPDEDVLSELRRRYTEGPRTLRPTARVYRFFNQQGHILIYSGGAEDSEAFRAEWFVEADSDEALYELANSIWPFYTLARSLRPTFGPARFLERCQAVVDRLTSD